MQVSHCSTSGQACNMQGCQQLYCAIAGSSCTSCCSRRASRQAASSGVSRLEGFTMLSRTKEL